MISNYSQTNQNVTSKALKGVHSQTAILAIKGILALAYFSMMSRLLNPDYFGYFALLTAITTILTSLSEAGLGSAVISSFLNPISYMKGKLLPNFWMTTIRT